MPCAASAHFCSTSALNCFQASGLDAWAPPAADRVAATAAAVRIASFIVEPPFDSDVFHLSGATGNIVSRRPM
jgi:hypothetical protein